MTEPEAIAAAQAVAQLHGWPRQEPTTAQKDRPLLVAGPARWQVVSNARDWGCNAVVVLDDATGKVVSARFAQR
jgi:hypothetical protein